MKFDLFLLDLLFYDPSFGRLTHIQPVYIYMRSMDCHIVILFFLLRRKKVTSRHSYYYDSIFPSIYEMQPLTIPFTLLRKKQHPIPRQHINKKWKKQEMLTTRKASTKILSRFFFSNKKMHGQAPFSLSFSEIYSIIILYIK